MATVLVVDDEFGIGELMEALLEDEGHRAITAMNGRHALERMAETPPDLVISDLMMPVLDGSGLLRAMRSSPDFQSIPFMLMCALPEDAISGMITGYDAFVRKPFKLAEMLRLVDRLLTGKPGEPAATA